MSVSYEDLQAKLAQAVGLVTELRAVTYDDKQYKRLARPLRDVLDALDDIDRRLIDIHDPIQPKPCFLCGFEEGTRSWNHEIWRCSDARGCQARLIADKRAGKA